MSMSVRGNRPPGGCRARIYIILWHNRARFGGTARNVYLCTGRRRKSAGFSSFRVLRGKLSYMSAKTILYDRKNYKQARENLLLDSFS